MGLWEKALTAATAFNRKRPFNLIGKNTLWLCALHDGDCTRAEAVQTELAELKTNRPAYLAAQAVINGTKTWEQVRPELNPRDEFLAQGVVAIAIHYYTAGNEAQARKVLEEMIPQCREQSNRELLESMLYGSMSRWLNQPRASAADGR